MGKRIITRQITMDEVTELRSIIAAAPWEPAKSARYANSPHTYIIMFRSGPEWKRFADLIRNCGVWRSWTPKGSAKSYHYKYLIIDEKAYWVDWPALNRADASTLDGYKVWGAMPSRTSTSSNQ